MPIGLARRAHGVAGEMLVRALGDTFQSLRAGERVVARLRRPADLERSLTVRSIRPTHGDAYILEVDEIRSREDAREACGAELCVPRSRLPVLEPGEFYRSDLLGLAVVSESGEPLGVVHAFLDLPQHDVLVVRDGAREMLLPMVEDSIHAIDLDASRIVASPFLAPLPARRTSAGAARRDDSGPAREGA